MQQAVKFGLSIKTCLLQRATSIIQIQCTFSVSHSQRVLLTSHSQKLLIDNPGKLSLREPQEEGHHFHPVHNITL